MKIGILYASKYGTTEKIAGSIAEKLKRNNEVELISLNKNPHPNINNFEMLIIGSSIYAGMASRKMKSFCKVNESTLLQKKTALFVCGMHIDKNEQEKELQTAFSEPLKKNSLAIAFLGGAYIFEKMNFFERMIIKKIEKSATSAERIEQKQIEEFVDKLK